MRRASTWKGALIATLGLIAGLPATAQTPAGPAAAAGPKLPIDISADQQEVFNDERRVVYIGNVESIQGQDRLRTPHLTIFYAKKDQAAAAKPATVAPGGASFGKIERMEAEGPVYVASPTQNARGDHGTYIAATDTTTLIGNVVLVQDKNVSTGDKLVIDKKTGHSTLYAKAGAQRVRGVFYQEQAPGRAPGAPAKPASSARP